MPKTGGRRQPQGEAGALLPIRLLEGKQACSSISVYYPPLQRGTRAMTCSSPLTRNEIRRLFTGLSRQLAAPARVAALVPMARRHQATARACHYPSASRNARMITKHRWSTSRVQRLPGRPITSLT
jgi:hypothetical protein